MMTQATQFSFGLGDSPSSPDSSTSHNAAEEQPDDFAALLAASWFTTPEMETPPPPALTSTSVLTSASAPVAADVVSEDSSETLSDQPAAAPLILSPALAAPLPPLPSNDNLSSKAVGTNELSKVVNSVQQTAVPGATVGVAEQLPVNLPSRSMPSSADELPTTTTDAAPRALLEPQPTSPVISTQRLASPNSVKEIGRKQEGVADMAGNLPSEGIDGAVSLRAEAARRDSISISSQLAEKTRQTRSPLLTSSLKPLLADSKHILPGVAPASDTPTADLLPQSDTGAPVMHAAPGKPESYTARAGEAAAHVPVDQQLTPSIMAAAEGLARREGRTLHFRLNPEELGQIEIRLTRDAGGRLSAQLITEHGTTRDVLADGMSHLRAALERAGLTVDRLTVDHSNAFVSSGWGNSSSGSHGTKDDRPHTSAFVDQASEADSLILTTGDTRPAQDRLLNLSA